MGGGIENSRMGEFSPITDESIVPFQSLTCALEERQEILVNWLFLIRCLGWDVAVKEGRCSYGPLNLPYSLFRAGSCSYGHQNFPPLLFRAGSCSYNPTYLPPLMVKAGGWSYGHHSLIREVYRMMQLRL